MTSNDGGSVHQANEQGLTADPATQSNLWSGDDERHDDGYRRDQFGNRVNDDGDRVDPEGRPMDASGNAVNEGGQRIGDDGKPLDDDSEDGGDIPGAVPPVPPVPPMMGR